MNNALWNRELTNVGLIFSFSFFDFHVQLSDALVPQYFCIKYFETVSLVHVKTASKSSSLFICNNEMLILRQESKPNKTHAAEYTLECLVRNSRVCSLLHQIAHAVGERK